MDDDASPGQEHAPMDFDADARIVAPDVVGMVVDEARDVAAAAGVTLAQPDPDGPPLAALTWRTGLRVTGQHPAPGASMARWDSLVVTWESGPDAGVRQPRRPLPRSVPGHAPRE